jgi:hypothetical protein
VSDSAFTEKLQALVALELAEAKTDADRMGEAIECLLASAALVIAVACRGDSRAMDEMLTGSSSHLYEMAADKARFGAFMAAIGAHTRGRP